MAELVIRFFHLTVASVFYRVVQKKLHKVYCAILLQWSATKSCGLHQNV